MILILLSAPEKSNFFREEGVQRGWAEKFADLRGGSVPGKNRGSIFSPIVEDRVCAMKILNQLTPKQIKNFQLMTE